MTESDKSTLVETHSSNPLNGKITCPTLEDFVEKIRIRNPGETEFVEAVEEVMESVWDLIQEEPLYASCNIPERITEPERVLIFRVPWTDDHGNVHVNRGYRVEFNSAIGPYKGGLRFHPSVNLDILKFLAFEQTFKNGLTTLPMGGGKGGSDFDVKGKSEMEVMRFCQSFMSELYRHIGYSTDVPAGDIGVGEREIGYLFGQYKRLSNKFNGTLTGKGVHWGGSLLRAEATGYGTVYFVREMLHSNNQNLKGKKVAISGSGNVAQYAAEKALHFGARVITMSDSDGTIYDKKGFDRKKLEFIMDLKNRKRGRIHEYAEKYDAEYLAGEKPWGIACDVALPCATENEISAEDAVALVENGCMCVAEGANKPSTSAAVRIFLDKKILFAPGKAANAGGVAVSGFEMSQNGSHTQWSRDEVDVRLQKIMKQIHTKCVEYGDTGSGINYVKGANIAAFRKVAEAMIRQGVV